MADVAGPAAHRSVPRAACRAAVAAAVILIGGLAITLLTRVPGYGRTRRGALGLHVLSRVLLRALGIRVVSRGAPRSGASLVVANQVSWIDVLVVHAAGPMVPVVREDFCGSPLIRAVFARAGAVIVGTRSRRGVPGSVEQIADLLRRGHRVQVFGESVVVGGTATNTFHRATFQAAIDAAVVISPVALAHRTVGTMSPPIADLAGDDLIGPMWRVLRNGPVTVRAHWLPVIPAVVGAGHPAVHRAAAATRAERAIATALGHPVTVGRQRVALALVPSAVHFSAGKRFAHPRVA